MGQDHQGAWHQGELRPENQRGRTHLSRQLKSVRPVFNQIEAHWAKTPKDEYFLPDRSRGLRSVNADARK